MRRRVRPKQHLLVGIRLLMGHRRVPALSCSSSSQILVFHFPGVIEGVKGGVSNQVPQRPLARHLVLGMRRPDRVVIGVAVSLQALLGQYSLLRLLPTR